MSPFQFAAIDPALEVQAVEVCDGAAEGARGSELCVVQADRRRVVARARPPGSVGAIGVTSLLTSHGRLLVGRRRGAPLGQPGSWELAASEDLDAAYLDRRTGLVDYRAALAARLVGCTPLSRIPQSRMVPFALAHDVLAGRWTLCLALELSSLSPSCAEIERASTADYESFRFVRPVDVIESGPDGAEELDPLSAALVRLPRADASAA